MEKVRSYRGWFRTRRPAAAIQAAKFGKRAALVEKLEVIGGTAIKHRPLFPARPSAKRSCIFPGTNIKAFTELTIRVKETITMADLSFRALNVIKTEIDVIRAQLSRNGIDVVTGTASFLDPRHIQVTKFARTNGVLKRITSLSPTGTKPAFLLLCLSMTRPSSIAIKILRMPGRFPSP